MNILLLDPQSLSGERASVRGQQAQHLRNVLKVSRGQTLSVGVYEGNMGTAEVISVSEDKVDLEIRHLNTPPPPMLPITLVLGLPRPRMLQRTLQTIATMGVEKLCLIQSSRVEKSFWHTPLLAEESIQENIRLGLEQGKATQAPKIAFHKRFRPFIEDTLPTLAEHKTKLVAHPGPYPFPQKAPQQTSTPCILAIGPEGGFIEKEVAQFQEHGFTPIQLGPRILRVETAIPVLLAKLYD